jgi:serine/threonine protein kinase
MTEVGDLVTVPWGVDGDGYRLTNKLFLGPRSMVFAANWVGSTPNPHGSRFVFKCATQLAHNPVHQAGYVNRITAGAAQVIQGFGYVVHSGLCGFFVTMASDGDLFEYLFGDNPHRFDEVTGTAVAQDLLLAISQLHHLGFVHNNIKPENCLMDQPRRAHSMSHSCRARSRVHWKSE